MVSVLPDKPGFAQGYGMKKAVWSVLTYKHKQATHRPSDANAAHLRISAW